MGRAFIGLPGTDRSTEIATEFLGARRRERAFRLAGVQLYGRHYPGHCVLFGIAPAWNATRAEIGTAIKDGGKASTKQRKGWSGRTLVAFQVALSTLLVVGASLSCVL